MKGDLYIDFAIAMVLFVIAFSGIFYYYNSELNSRIQNEKKENAYLKIQNIFNSLKKEIVEKRIILVGGNSINEFINLSGYDIDLILDTSGKKICFDQNLEGFITNISGESRFYLYSTKKDINKYICTITNFNNTLDKKISTPIYEEFFIDPGNYTGEFCEQRTLLIFSENGPIEKKIKICV